MEDALSDYGETLLFVSHDRYFIEKFATRIWAFENGVLTDYRGGYAAYVAWKEHQAVIAGAEKKAADKSGVKKASPQAGSDAAGKPDGRPRGGNQARQMQRAEKEITRLEGQLAALEEECAIYATDYQKLMELEAQKEALNTALMEQYERWEALSDEA
jgi:ATPase subunit of ABC transporter with duplicated ATPase domains